MEKIRVGIVNYLNTLPLLYGLEHSGVMKEIFLIKDYPSRIAAGLLTDKIDIGLVPVGVLPQLGEYNIVSEYGIACDGPVASVCLFSQVPLEEVSEVLLDYQSRTSLLLVQLLFQKYWQKNVQFIDTREDFEDGIQGKCAGLLIGDRCLRFRTKARYMYDLGAVWKQYTGLPFVFAVWAAKHPLPSYFLKEFNEANGSGVASLPDVIAQNHCDYYDLEIYFRQNIRYHLDGQMLTGMQRFLQEISEPDIMQH